jgi:hypothetical protein
MEAHLPIRQPAPPAASLQSSDDERERSHRPKVSPGRSIPPPAGALAVPKHPRGQADPTYLVRLANPAATASPQQALAIRPQVRPALPAPPSQEDEEASLISQACCHSVRAVRRGRPNSPAPADRLASAINFRSGRCSPQTEHVQDADPGIHVHAGGPKPARRRTTSARNPSPEDFALPGERENPFQPAVPGAHDVADGVSTNSGPGPQRTAQAILPR